MSKIFDEIMAIYRDENTKRNHLVLLGVFLIYVCLCFLSGNDTYHSTVLIDLIWNIFILGLFSVFMQKLLKENQIFLPALKEIRWDQGFNLFLLTLVWFIYAVILGGGILLLCSPIIYNLIPYDFYIIPDNWLYIKLSILTFAVVFIFLIVLFYGFSTSFLTIALIDNNKFKGLLNPATVFSIRGAFLPYIGQLIKYILITLLTGILYIGCLLGIKVLIASEILNVILIILITVPFGYMLIMLWQFTFPQALLNIYTEKVKPIIDKIQSEEY